MDLQIDITDENALALAARKLLDFAGPVKVFAFNGNMGAGKTTFIKQLCRTLGVQGSLSSPTYAIVNEYNGHNGKIFHFDLYRIKVIDELFDLGFEEYLQSGQYCFIEWPQIAQELMVTPCIDVTLSTDGAGRSLSAVKT